MNAITEPARAVETLTTLDDPSSVLLAQILDRVERIERRPSAAVQPMELRTFEELERWAERAARSDMVPRDYKGKPDSIIIAVQMGSEVGLRPMQSLQNIASLNGRPCIWGDAMLALCKNHPAWGTIEETVTGEGDERHATCIVQRRGEKSVVVHFSVLDAKIARLWGKMNTPWQTYPDRMLQLRARGFALRDAFPDALRGLISAEEAADYPEPISAAPEPPKPAPAPKDDPPKPRRPSVSAWLEALQRDLDAAHDVAAVDAIVARDDVRKATAKLTGDALARLNALVLAAQQRVAPAENDEPDGDLGWPVAAE